MKADEHQLQCSSGIIQLSDQKDSSITTTDDIWRVRVDLGSATAHHI